MTTFSQLVDAMILECRRPDMRNEIISYANQTIREVHMEPSGGGATLLKDNFNEGIIIASSPSGFTWQIDPARFQAMQIVYYPAVDQYAPEVTPSRRMRDLTYYCYRVGGTYVFSGYGGVGALIKLGWFEYPKRLAYFESGVRPAEYDADIGWTYFDDFNTTEDLRVTGQQLVSNWLLLRWVDVIAEGIRAKVYKRLSDTERARTCYSLYGSLRMGLLSSEQSSPGGYS